MPSTTIIHSHSPITIACGTVDNPRPPQVYNCRREFRDLHRLACGAGDVGVLGSPSRLKHSALVVLLAITGVGIVVATTFMGRQTIPDRLEINGLHIVKDGIVSLCLLPLAGGDIALFDAGNDKSGKAIRGELARLGLGSRNVGTIILTHGHLDHIAGVPLFPDAQVILAMRLAGQGGVQALVFSHSGVLKQGIEPLTLAARSW